jgi:hypothetical protein
MFGVGFQELILLLFCAGVVVVALVVIAIVFIIRAQQASNNSNLMPCPDCRRMLSRQAQSCPQCGRPLP